MGCKLLGPRSRRKRAVETSDEEKEYQSEDDEHKVKAKEANLTVVNEIECALSPPSPKKDATTDHDEEGDHQDEEDVESKEGHHCRCHGVLIPTKLSSTPGSIPAIN